MTDITERKKPSLERRAIIELWRLAQLFVVFSTLYSLIAEVVNKAAVLIEGVPVGMTAAAALAADPLVEPFIKIVIPLPDPLAELIIACIVIGVLTYIVLKWVCESQWVRETVEIEECWEEVKWYNPFSWFVAIVCTIVEVVKWVLKQICGWVEALVIVLVILCIVISIIVVVAL